MTMTSSQFLEELKQLITLPANNARLNNAALLRFANRKMKDTVFPVIHSVNQEFFVTKSLVPIVANTVDYALPARAAGRKLREIKLANSAGNRSDFPQIAIEREQFYRASSVPAGFYFYGDKIEVVPTPTASGYSLQLWWYLPPSALVPVADAALVTSVSGDDVTVASVPSTLTTGTDVDFIAGTQGNSCLGIDAEITGIAGTTISFAADTVPTGLAAGDYISVAQTSPVLQIPDDAAPYLVTLTGMECLQAISDFEGRKILKEIADEQKTNLLSVLAPRAEGEPIPLINDYGFIGGPRRGLWGAWGYL